MKKLKLIFLIISFCLVAALPAALSRDGQGTLNSNSLPPKKPQRIVSLSPGHTEILFALGAGERIVGVSSFSDYPEEAKTKPTLGNYLSPDLEKILSLNPDIIFALSQSQAQYINVLKQAGICVVALEPKTMQEILSAVEVIAQAVGEAERGEDLTAQLKGQLAKVRAKIADVKPKRIFVEVWDTPLLTIGNQSFINDIVRQAGGINVAAERNLSYAPCDIESLYVYNPEVYIVVSHEYKKASSIINKPEFVDIEAVKNNRVSSIWGDLLVRSGPRCFAGLAELAKIIHPEVF